MTIGIIRPTLLSIGLMSMIGCTALQNSQIQKKQAIQQRFITMVISLPWKVSNRRWSKL